MRVATAVCALGFVACAHASPPPKPVAEVPIYAPGEPRSAQSPAIEDRNKALAPKRSSVDSTTQFSDGHGNMRDATPWVGPDRAQYWNDMKKEALPPPTKP